MRFLALRCPLLFKVGKWGLFFSFLALCSGCGYHFQGGVKDDPSTISVSYIKGDDSGRMNAMLGYQLATLPHLEYRKDGGVLDLQVTLLGDDDQRIGYRYDRNPSTGRRRKNIVGIENRRIVVAEVKLVDTRTEKVLMGPVQIVGRADYDYIDPNSIRDLTFTNSEGKTATVMNFSLGQLDSVEGGHDDAGVAVYRQLAQKIGDALVCYGW